MAADRGDRNYKRISGSAYQALRSALALVYWYKPSLERHLRAPLRDHPEVLAGIDFKLKKREIADSVVDRLIDGESRYQRTTVALMLEVAEMDSFPELEQHEDSDKWLPRAINAVAELRKHTEEHGARAKEREEFECAERASYFEKVGVQRRFSDELASLRATFFELHDMSDPHRRGKLFEGFLNNLFELFDLDPRLGYSLETEQIDGAFTFDTDDYIMEAKWTKTGANREQADAFAAKVHGKGKNALGLIVSVNGLTLPARKRYSQATPFMTLDGGDLFFVFEGRGRLDELLRRKKRHANETGECYFPASQMFE
ncbi:hypothetical protein [Frankia sp. Cr1]|uniref:hypothetical protein n=1 Tax=Frankia sp. Cr1 TaxID=3073931 RepID=UPI002AD2A137|nr:hypothetical protein [Frankia sp. Cr1]